MKKYIGGFPELEVFSRPGPGYHAAALGLSNARACLSHLIAQTQMQRVWLPYYTCNALLEPFEQAGVPYQFYALTAELTLADGPGAKLGEGEYVVYVNYFGLKNTYVRELVERYGDQLLVDNTQDYFARGYDRGWSFNSARKAFGVPDGGYLYGPAGKLGTAVSYPENTEYHVQYLADRLRGAQQQAYEGFMAYERTLTSQPLRISAFSAALLSQVDYAAAVSARRTNYARYHEQLGELNLLPVELNLTRLPPDTVPFCYPLLLAGGEQLDRRGLFTQNIFVPTLWPDVLTRQAESFEWERQLTRTLLPLPLDQRYGSEEIDFVVRCLWELLGK